jgi:hypothetical protein
LIADEKHTWCQGQRVYVATTVAQGCFLGVGLAAAADTESLTQAYGEFHQEALTLKPDYAPNTVNTDGWESTQKAWQSLFPTVTWVLCFLHTVLGIVQCCRTQPMILRRVCDKLWHLYGALNKSQFAQRLRRLREWATDEASLPEPVRRKLLQIPDKAPRFKVAFDFPDAYRTSNALDRLMNFQDRLLYSMQYFHGTFQAAQQALRAIALLWNFHPYSRKVQATPPHSMSPFEDLNGFRYHDNWLRNLLIASSLNGKGAGQPVKHTLG